MNYILEIKAFYNRQASNELSASAVALWHTLLYLNNEAWWAEKFKAAGTIVRFQSGLSESSFKRARKELVEHGYIEFESQGAGRAPFYKLHSLVVDPAVVNGREERVENELKVGRRVDRDVSESVDRQVTEATAQGTNGDVALDLDLGASPLYKQYINKNNTKENKLDAADETQADGFGDEKDGHGEKENVKSADAIVFYQKNFGVASPFVVEELLDWISNLGDELVIVAMERAFERNKMSWGYVKSILKSWQKKGIRTVADAEAEQVAFEQERKQKQGYKGNGGAYHGNVMKREIVPEWFEAEWKKSEEKRRARQTKWKKGKTQEEARAEVEELLEKYRV